MTTPCPYGFRVVGPMTGARRLVKAAAAFAGYAAYDLQARIDREAYLSAFTNGADFRAHLETTGSTRGFTGPCAAAFIWWDLDRPDDMQRGLNEARRLAAFLLDRYPALDDDDLLVFFSAFKGFHVGLPVCWRPTPFSDFNKAARRFAERLATAAGIAIDASIYDKVRCFRAPNSRHPKTGFYKRRLALDELIGLTVEGIRRLASRPEPFDVPAPTAAPAEAAADWSEAVAAAERETVVKREQRAAAAEGVPRLNRQTLDFIRDGADVGDRHRMLFSAAANLGEFGCSPALAHALLTEAALDSGLSPSDTRRQIDCGLNHVREPEGGNPDG